MNKLSLHCALVAAFLAAGAATMPAQAVGPAYTWNNVKIGGGGYVPGIIAHPGQQGLFYVRTDVGGAYRYNSATRTWIPLNDWISSDQFSMSGIDAIAIDPSDPNKLYMVGGIYYEGAHAVLMISNNQGGTFTQVPLSFSTGGNAKGRQVGERLMVDPNLGSVLFYGTGNYAANASTNGLWKSSNSGASWTKVSGFPALSSDGTGAGISFIAFHKASTTAGHATPTIFAGINTKTAEQTGSKLYKSTDGGNTWSPIWGGPGGLLPQRGQIGPDGNLYITFAASLTYMEDGQNLEHYGPDGLGKGQVWKYNVATDQWTYITPWSSNNTNGEYSWGFSGLSVDPSHAGRLMVNTIDRYDTQGDTTYVSNDGGATWTDLVANATFDSSAKPWTTVSGPIHNTGNWNASVLDPFNVSHAFVTSGGGIMESTNLTAANPTWAFGDNGIEEVVLNSLISPPPNQYGSTPLISGGPDVCGFVHANLSTAPSASFSSPTCSGLTGMDYKKTDSTYLVRVEFDTYNTDKRYGAISWNGGYTWSPFNSNGTATKGGGSVAVNADGSTILWAPQDAPPAYSNNNAYSWNSLSGVLPNNVKITADGYNANMFYAYDRNVGTFYVSGDKGATWQVTNAGLIAWGDQLVAPTGLGGEVWLVTYNGLYHTQTSGWGAWVKAPGVTQAAALGFGKAAAGASYPAMYVDGTVGGVRGIHRSTDGGSTWVRINDDQHQWYGTNHVITGDPKTFGTVYIGTNGRGIIYGTSSN